MSLIDINIRGSYTGKGTKILQEFLIPALSNAVKYDRITGFFTIDSLLSIANGIDALRKNNGEMRLIVGLHSVPEEIIEATINKDKLSEEIKRIQVQIESEIYDLTDLLEKQKIATVAWMIESGLLSIKAAAVKGDGIFHPKTIILKDENNNEVVAVGSSNETRNGLGDNFEQLMVATSWNNVDAVNDQKNFFNHLWNNKNKDAYVFDITQETAEIIKHSLKDDYERIIKMMLSSVENVFSHLADTPVNFFTSGNIPALYMHQERAVLDALSRWPVRVLFSDEVGLGKTFEAAATIAFLNKYCQINRVLILTPKSVLKQWQDELRTHFGLDVWLYDSSRKQYISSNNKAMKVKSDNPLGYGSPGLLLMSSQFVRGNRNSKGLLSAKGTILPQLLVVDEAHSARVSDDLSGKKKKTQMYKMLENVSKKIPHIILATATPMQKKAIEYHAMLKLLGLPKIWEKEENFMQSLHFIVSDDIDLSDANKIASLLYHTYTKMEPDLSTLTNEERKLLNNLFDLFKRRDYYDIATFVQNNWNYMKEVFIKIHPARLLTIRNTRRSLAEIGYKFPKRNLYEKTLYDSNAIKLFYSKVNKYLTEDCFSVEKEMNPDKKINISFVRVSYQQRVASSLNSCKKSLERRLSNIEQIQNQLESNFNFMIDYSFDDSIDDFDDDDLLNLDLENYSTLSNKHINKNNLRKAVNTEFFSLKSLISDVNFLLKTEGDKKIDESIDLALQTVQKGDSVLLFSRYTDTVNSLIENFKNKNRRLEINYAIYTGDTSSIIIDGNENECDKEEIKKSLFFKQIQVVFCSDAASEGLNLQAARVLINVDVPWTPARLEQRIGRIARLGQIADEVDIYNVWYPNSVEAKMYRRIQERLKNTNIAIGEFPEVVAENIKHAILNDSDDNSLEILNNIRNDLQKGALDALWSNVDQNKTYSDLIRNKLIKICKEEFNFIKSDNDRYTFLLDDGKLIEVTTSPGQKNTINLKTNLLLKINKKAQGLKLIKNSSYDIGLIDIDENKMVKTESVLENIINQTSHKYDYYESYPATLPDPRKLNLSYAMENFHFKSPNYWIESDSEDK